MINNFLNRLTGPLLILFFSLGILSCSKKVVPVATVTPPVVKTVDVEEIGFGYMHGKARMVYKDEKKERDVKASIRIRKDSVIWMTFTVIGVQGGKVLINKDSITVVSFVDREYYVFDYKELSKKFKFEINYQMLEAAILGNLIQQKSPNDVITEASGFNILTQLQGEVTIKNFINQVTKKIEEVDLNEPTTGNSLHVKYAGFQPLGDRSFPYQSEVKMVYKGINGIINNSITVEFNKAEVGDKELKFPFNIPRKYDRR
jgi:Domain of unknown function (DUF4292)